MTRAPLALRRFALLATAALVGAGTACAPRDATTPTREARAEEAWVALDRRGGDVWAFERRIEGRSAAVCARVVVEGPRGRIDATPRRGRFAAVVPLSSGENEVVATCVDREGRRGAAASVRLHVRLADRPTARVRVSIVEGKVALDAGASTPSPVGLPPLASYEWTSGEGNPAPLRVRDGDVLSATPGESVVLDVPPRDGDYFVRLLARDVRGVVDRAEATFRVVGGKPVAVAPERETPSWAEGAIVYGVVPHLFGDPPLDAVRARLPALAALGVNTLWLTPVQAAPGDDFGYEVLDHFTLRASLGEPDDLEALVRDAHALGLRVLLDFVPNHTSRHHPYFEDAEAHGRRSAFYDFYERGADGEPLNYFDWEHLPNLDFDREDVRRMIIEAAAHWVRRYGVDGFRVDVAWGVDRRAPELFAEIRAELARIDADVLLLAEASARDAHLFDAGFDVAYDWTDEVGKWAWAPVFVEGRADLDALDAAIRASEGAGRVFRFLDNNDTGPRFVTTHGRGLHRAASALLFTLPGVPALFTGQEVEAEFEPYQREEPIAFEGPPDALPHFAALARLRACLPALRGEVFVPLEATPADRVYAYARGSGASDEVALVVVNFGDSRVNARVALDDATRDALLPSPAEAYGEGPPIDRDGSIWSITLPPWGARVLVPRSGTALAPAAREWQPQGARPRARRAATSSPP